MPQQVFKILSRDYGTAGNSKQLVLNFDQDMVPVLREATELLHPDPSEPIRLLEALGDKTLTQGLCTRTEPRHVLWPSTAHKTFFQILPYHSTIAWFLLQLGITGNGTIHNDPLVLQASQSNN